VWRSILSVPLNVPRFVQGACRFAADALMLDLEDGVPDPEKPLARAALEQAPSLVARGGADVIVRINNVRSSLAADVEAAVAPEVSAILIPKAEDPEVVRSVDELILCREHTLGLPGGSVRIFVSIETSFGVHAMDELLCASDRIVATMIGQEDLAADLGIEPTGTGKEFRLVSQLLVLAARRAGVQAIGVGSSEYSDLGNFRERAIEAQEIGVTGGMAIHPAQIPVLNEVFSPSETAVTAARSLIDVWEQSRGEAIAWRGRMIDKPVADRAYRLVRRWEAVTAREAAKTGRAR
jgi:citrate lyase subunit beta/citryl-CoA lyase